MRPAGGLMDESIEPVDAQLYKRLGGVGRLAYMGDGGGKSGEVQAAADRLAVDLPVVTAVISEAEAAHQFWPLARGPRRTCTCRR